MNTQIRRLFLVVLAMFFALGLAVTNNHVIRAPQLNADSRNARTILHAAEVDRGPIIVSGEAVAQSSLIEGTKRYQRTYPQGPLYGHVTGYFSAAFFGATGLEASASQVLEGESQALLAQRLRNLFTGNTRQGGGIVLTLNPAMQQVAAEQLGNRKGAVVALDATTGAILALYSSPTYDPNSLAASDGETANAAYQALLQDPSNPLYNRAIAGDLYAPGSTFKILTTVALLKKGITADTPMESPVTTTLPLTETQISNIESVECGNGMPTLAEAFARSCNTTFVIASEKLTYDDFSQVAKDFGFGQSLLLPTQATASSFPESADAAQLALSSIGQYEVKVTPLQMAQVVQAIANGGQMMAPYLISEIVDADLQTQSTTKPTMMGSPVSAEVAKTMTAMMRAVVEEPYGTGTSMAMDGIAVAAKTGTAEVGTEGYANAWAVGFAPADAPRIAFAVLVEGDENEPVPHGGTTAGPIARALLEAGLQ